MEQRRRGSQIIPCCSTELSPPFVFVSNDGSAVAARRRRRGSTWSSQLTPGYLPDWICSSSHGLSLSRPACCMLRVCLSLGDTGASMVTQNFAHCCSAQVGSYLVLGHPTSSLFQSEASTALSAALHETPLTKHNLHFEEKAFC